MTVKKAYTDIVTFLQDNKDKKVSTILADVIAMASAKSGGGAGGSKTFHKNEAGEVVAIRCYYHQKWMDPRVVEFGKKESSASGYNTMCKDGVSKWTKQQREAKHAREALLQKLSTGELSIADLPTAQAEIDEAVKAIVPREDGYGFDTLEDLLAATQG